VEGPCRVKYYRHRARLFITRQSLDTPLAWSVFASVVPCRICNLQPQFIIGLCSVVFSRWIHFQCVRSNDSTWMLFVIGSVTHPPTHPSFLPSFTSGTRHRWLGSPLIQPSCRVLRCLDLDCCCWSSFSSPSTTSSSFPRPPSSQAALGPPGWFIVNVPSRAGATTSNRWSHRRRACELTRKRWVAVVQSSVVILPCQAMKLDTSTDDESRTRETNVSIKSIFVVTFVVKWAIVLYLDICRSLNAWCKCYLMDYTLNKALH